VHVAPDGKAALALLAQGLQPDLLFTDLMMPGMNGRELSEQARKLQPGLKVLFTSGFAEHAIMQHNKPEGGFALLSKPYSLSDLAKKIREELDRKS
jgi:CheY-like chemotaxis protein